MGRTIGPRNKIARAFGIQLGLKTNSARVARRLSQRPGVHGPGARRRTLSTFGKQLIEKQKAKALYGLRDRQFRTYVKEATRRRGDSNITLMHLLETRLDNVVYRLGFAVTRAQARQMVGHGMIAVNGKKTNIPSCAVKTGDTIEIRESKKESKLFDGIVERLHQQSLPSWLSINPAELKGSILHLPKAEDLEHLFDVGFIIEYYATR